MKKTAYLILILIQSVNILGQTIQVSDKLSLIQLSESSYIPTCENSNGIV